MKTFLPQGRKKNKKLNQEEHDDANSPSGPPRRRLKAQTGLRYPERV